MGGDDETEREEDKVDKSVRFNWGTGKPEVSEPRKEREPETKVEDKEFERIVQEYRDYYVSYTAETICKFPLYLR